MLVAPRPVIAAGSGPGQPAVVTLTDTDTGAVLHTLAPYPGFFGGVRVAVGDLTGDAYPDVVTVPGLGGGPHVKVYDGRTGTPVPGPLGGFTAFDPAFSGGVEIAVGDVTGDGVPDVVAAAGLGGGPHVKVFDGKTRAVVASFFAFEPEFRCGVSVAVGRFTPAAAEQVVLGAGPGGGPRVRVIDIATMAPVPGPVGDFFAFDPSFRGGVSVSAGDVTGDNTEEVIAGAGPGGGPHVKIFDGLFGGVAGQFMAGDPASRGAVRVGAAYLDGDRMADVVAATGAGSAPRVRAYSGASGVPVIGPAADFDPGVGAGWAGVSLAAGNDPGTVSAYGEWAINVTTPGGPVTLPALTVRASTIIQPSQGSGGTTPGSPSPTETVTVNFSTRPSSSVPFSLAFQRVLPLSPSGVGKAVTQATTVATAGQPTDAEWYAEFIYSGDSYYGVNGTGSGQPYPNASVGDRVWDDLNGDGVQDAGEPGRDGVTVRLLGGSGSGVLATTATSGGGLYTFGGLAAGSYRVQVVNPDPALYWFPDPDQADDIADSDGYSDQPEQFTVTTKAFALAVNEKKADVDQAVAVKIKSVTWEKAGILEGGVLDENKTMPGGGKRIFAERTSYGDAAASDQVTVRVELAVPMPDVVIRGYVYDVDDPSASQNIVDEETSDSDNRSAVGVGEFSGKSNEFGVFTKIIQVSQRPGDNYRAVATVNKPPQGGPTVQAKRDDGERAGVYFVADGSPVPPANDKTVKSELLTVWRTLHVERDHMGAPANRPDGTPEPFLGAGTDQGATKGAEGADDVAPSGAGGAVIDPSIEWMQTIYPKAYVEVKDDVGAFNTRKEIPFVHNLDFDGGNEQMRIASEQVTIAQNVTDSPTFWVIQLVGGYEADTSKDNDFHGEGKLPNPDKGVSIYAGYRLSGAAGPPMKAGPCVVFTEAVRDWATEKLAAGAPGAVSVDVLMARIAAHESVHAWGLSHDFPANTVGVLKFADNNWAGRDDENLLEPVHINAIRS